MYTSVKFFRSLAQVNAHRKDVYHISAMGLKVQYVFSWNLLYFQDQSFEIILRCQTGLSEYVNTFLNYRKWTKFIHLFFH